jgi:hypothetical protein
MSAEALTRQLLLRVQNDAYGRILAHSYFSDVAIIQERKALTTQEIAKLLSTVKGRSNKVGAAIIVHRPSYFPASDDTSGRGQILQSFTALEHPTINAGDIGTGKSAEELSLELFLLFNQVAASVPSQVYTAFPGGAVTPDDSFEGFNAWLTRLQLFGNTEHMERCGVPLITPDSGASPQSVTLTTATGGASIYYTTDGSFPSDQNEEATLYTGAIAIAEPTTIRAAAQKTGMQQSGIAEATFT